MGRTRTQSIRGAVGAAACCGALLVGTSAMVGPTALAAAHSTTVVQYDNFAKPGGYTLADYDAKWNNLYGPLEMTNHDTRQFAGNAFHVSAAPFATAADFSVFDHLKYFAVSRESFPVPATGSVEISSVITAQTPGTTPDRTVTGSYSTTGLPYVGHAIESQQAAAVMNVIDFHTGQLFDIFVSGHSVMALVERLPSNVTGNTSDVTSPDYVGRDKMYTQIIKAAPASAGPHAVSIRFSRDAAGVGHADYLIDGAQFAHVDHVGVPLDRQAASVPFQGSYPSLGAGEELGAKIDSLAIGHGLFSLLDAFPFQHPEAPELAVSVPTSQRAFGQGVIASFDDFKVKTVH
jgi:hypothetical protein